VVPLRQLLPVFRQLSNKLPGPTTLVWVGPRTRRASNVPAQKTSLNEPSGVCSGCSFHLHFRPNGQLNFSLVSRS